jgi:hypothetical protein
MGLHEQNVIRTIAGTHMGKVVIKMAPDLDRTPPNAGGSLPHRWPALPPRKQADDEQAAGKSQPQKPALRANALPVFSSRSGTAHASTCLQKALLVETAVACAATGARMPYHSHEQSKKSEETLSFILGSVHS